jgi:D-3-phosphoglycerate dehydrogenase
VKIAILDDYQNAVKKLDCYTLLAELDTTIYTDTPGSLEELVNRLSDKDALVLIRERTEISPQLLARLPNLKLISQTGKISNHINLQACNGHRVAIAEGVGSPIAPSELCWSLILASSRHIVPYVDNFQQGVWQSSGSLGLGRALNNLTIGIWGYGKIGQRIAQYAKAFGMKVMIWGSQASRDRALTDGFEAAHSKRAFFAQSDVLSLHLRLSPETRACVTYDDLQLMKKDALIVNTSRAQLIETSALPRSLKTGRPGFAALDVYDSEPTTIEQEPLLAMPNVLCAPHLGYVEKNNYELYFKMAFENVVNFYHGEPQNIANPEVL